MLLHWFGQLQSRERRALIIGSVALLGILGYTLYWEPTQRRLHSLRAQVAGLEADYHWMQQAADEAKILQRRPVTKQQGGASLLGMIDHSLRQSPLAKTEKRIEPRGSERVILDFAQVEFAALLRWLQTLHNRYHLRVDSISLEQGKQPGGVRARLTLQRAAAG